MRIIAGKHKSRKLETLEGMNTRPMMDKMKESVFNIIGPYFDDGLALDLFGGSGALSLEAISRGIKHSYIVDNNANAVKIINKNIATLNEKESVTIFNCDYKLALNRLKNLKFDVVFLDPPYRMNIVNEILDYLLHHGMINDQGYVVCQYVRGNATINNDLRLIKNYSHGSSEVAVYQCDKKTNEAAD